MYVRGDKYKIVKNVSDYRKIFVVGERGMLTDKCRLATIL